MARDEDDNDGLPPIGEGTDKFLEQAKKGQARNFLLVCKGAKLSYLAVRKKPIKKNELNEAKKAGYKGEGYFGVITGKGMELVFNLSLADGYTAEPVKDKILKDFLEEKADFKCKPTIAIVATLPEVPFDEEDLKNPLIARFAGLAQKISDVLDINPNAAGEIQQTSSEIRLLLQDGNFDDATPRVDAFEVRLSQLLAGQSASTASAAPQPSESQSSATVETDDQGRKLKLQEALNKLVPQIKQAVATFPDRKVELLTPVATIKKQIEDGQLEDAKQGLMGLAKTLKDLQLLQAAPSTSETDSGMTEFIQRCQVLEPKLLEAKTVDREKATKLGTVWDYANEQAKAGNFANAFKALERLEKAIAEVLSGTPSPSSDGNSQRAQMLLGWQKAREAAISQLKQLEAAIVEAGYEESPGAIILVKAIIKNLTPNPDSLQAVAELERYLETDQIILDAETPNGWGITVQLRGPLLGALLPLKQALAV